MATGTEDTLSGPPRQDVPAPGKMPRLPVDCGDLGMRIARDGTWYYNDSPIGRLPLVKLFATVLRRDEAGVYWLVTPAERGRIAVDDVPFIAVDLDVRGEGQAQELIFRTNLDETATADTDHPLRVETREPGGPHPYLLVRNGLEARLARSVFYRLVECGREERVGDAAMFGVWSKRIFFPLGTLEP
ncbi:MAG TPA: DUF1285 domain-containing protein [Stellaceae bacterium]|nr:DUF1285 domain-containing protein [Stellaceae bacterium]